MRYEATTEEILRTIQEAMKALFELDPARVHPDTRLIEDLDLDSIDALDLAARIEEATGRAFDEASLRNLRTIQDVITAIQAIVEDASPKERIPA
jgi:acyl carrier protein